MWLQVVHQHHLYEQAIDLSRIVVGGMIHVMYIRLGVVINVLKN